MFRLDHALRDVYASGAVRRVLTLLAGFLSILMPSSATSQGPLPVLRGIVLIANGEGRAYFADPQTGALGGYTVRETVGDCQIEQIREDRVVLRRGSELVQILLGTQSAASNLSAQVTMPRPAALRPSTAQVTLEARPSIGNGQPWLDTLGIPPEAFSRAIEEALPVQQSANLPD